MQVHRINLQTDAAKCCLFSWIVSVMWDSLGCSGKPDVSYFIPICQLYYISQRHLWNQRGYKCFLCIALCIHAERTNWHPRFSVINEYAKEGRVFTDDLNIWNLRNLCGEGFWICLFRQINTAGPLVFCIIARLNVFTYPKGAQSKGKLHVHDTDNTHRPPAGDTFAVPNLSQKQTVTKFCRRKCSADYTVFQQRVSNQHL